MSIALKTIKVSYTKTMRELVTEKAMEPAYAFSETKKERLLY
uniref:Uncharacterized protein n=1 Tax=viral metagenome TaxID=1070528 RepID=A0A6C0J414_9ZZZZ